MGKYYYFAALGTGHAMQQNRENWKKYYTMSGPLGGVHQMMLDNILQARAAQGRPIPRDEITLVHPDDWACPDLGKMQPHCLDDIQGKLRYQQLMEPGISAWFAKVLKPDGNPEIISSTGNDGVGVYGCLCEVLPKGVSYNVVRNTADAPAKPAEKKEKKKLFNW